MNAEDNLRDIRLKLLWDRIRNLNTYAPEDVYQALKAMPVAEWIETMQTAGLQASTEDLTTIHDWLWPEQEAKS